MNNVSPSQSTTPYVLKVNGALKNPEIVLLGEPENPCSSALIVQTSIEFEYKLIDNRQNFSTTSTDLMVHSCRYPDRQKTLYKVVKPCAINFRYSYPGTDCEGQEIRLCVPEMKIKVSPLLLKTLLAIYASFYGDQQTNEEDTSEPVSNTEENNEFWKPRPVCKENRYQEQARVPSRIHLNTAVMEKFSLEIKSVRLTLYNEVMAHRVPLLLVNCTIVSNVQDWSSELKLATDLSMEAWYYNETFAAWEPLIESEESLNGRHLWQLELKVFKGESHILLFSPDSEEQKLIEEEDFESLTSLPVTGNSRHGFRQQSPLRSSISEVDGEEQNPNLDEGQAPMVIDEVDNCAPRSPFLSVSSDIIPQATYIVLSSDDIMQLTVTRPAVDVLTHISEIFTKVTSAAPSETTLPESPFAVINDLGIHTSVSLGYRHETTQGSTPELSITRKDRKGVSEQTNNDQDTSKSYPAELYMLDPSSHRIPSSKSSKDDSVIYQKHDVHDCWEEDDTNNAEDENDFGIEIVKAPAGKRFIRSISLPAKDMRSKMKVADQKGRQDKSDINIVVEKEPVVDHNQSITSLPENEISIHHDQLDSKKISNIDFPVGIKPGKKHKSNRSFEKRKGLHLGSINEDIMEDEKKESEFNKVQTNTSEESKEPSFISGAFATMGLIAGISGHPVSGAERLIDKHAEESKAVLFERPEYKKANDYISIKVDGFEELPFVLVTRAGRFLYQLRPKKHGRHFYIVVQIAIKHGQKRVTIRSPLQVKNNMDIAIDLIQSGTVRINTSADYPSASKKDQTISTIQPKEVGNLPLFCAHKGNFFIRPCADGFMKSTTSVSWEHFSGNNQANILTCFPEENGPKYTFCVKVHCEPDSLNTTPSRMAPHHILHLHPTISFGNFLPFSLTLKLKESNTHIMVIEPSKRHQLTCVTTNKESEFSLKACI